ncbi:hypothetical protein E2C01_005445 [Portunus trituberculatus]|uniref:Uncharacterized protein n=1 Tax=Portunus trituberculatus TaxID=210409 RepID=A0A5B7CV63_PORTR|nr:hypothetical protein [Portunus trituberculatus]
MEPSSAARHMTEPKHTPCGNQRIIETPIGLRKLTDDIMDKDFSGFRDERSNMRRLVNIERELRYTKEVMTSLMDKQDRLLAENTALKLRVTECEKDKVQHGITDRVEGGLGDKLKELRIEWRHEQEEEKVKFSEVVRRQIQENTKVAVIEAIKEKEDLVPDAVDKKKSFVIYGMREKKI